MDKPQKSDACGTTCHVSPYLVTIAVHNLLVNARKYGKQNGQPAILQAVVNNEAVIVEDQEIGFPANILARAPQMTSNCHPVIAAIAYGW